MQYDSRLSLNPAASKQTALNNERGRFIAWLTVSGFPNSCNLSLRLNLTGFGEYPGGFLGKADGRDLLQQQARSFLFTGL
ncbi:hypothetical protein NC651_019658 [Populus alba x Populus x berolinensis]|nr:hypothetical protein NC651_019658 [Populus alba x Populus x berolinensis]